MGNTIPPFSQVTPTPSCRPLSSSCQTNSFSQASTAVQEARIAIMTAEGDTVSISSKYSLAQTASLRQQATPAGHLQQFTTASLASSSYNLTVQGDLNAEELADIASLLNNLTGIAQQFYSGQLDEAMQAGLQLGDLGSLTQLTASFSQQLAVATRLTSQSTVQAAGPQSDKALTEIDRRLLPAQKEQTRYQELLQAQWQQIKAYLAQETTTGRLDDPPGPEKKPPLPAAERMMARVRKTMAEHPRLSPFAAALGNMAILRANANAAGRDTLSPSDNDSPLWPAYLRHLNDWLLAD